MINISSIHATHAFPNSTAYACSKAGLVALTRNLALELAPRRIRVNAICPGYIDTRLWEEYMRQIPDAEALAAKQIAALHPARPPWRSRRTSPTPPCFSRLQPAPSSPGPPGSGRRPDRTGSLLSPLGTDKSWL